MHRIDIEAAVANACPDLPDDEYDDLLAVIYAWRDEALTDQRRSMSDHPTFPAAMARHLGIQR